METVKFRPISLALALCLALILAACASAGPRPGPSGDGQTVETGEFTIVPGKTTREQLSQALGKPTELIKDGRREIWVYGPKITIPGAVSMIPVIGDITDLYTFFVPDEELIVQLDEAGRVRKYKRRKVD